MADTLSNIGEGEAYYFDKMKPHLSIVLEQKTIVLKNVWGGGLCPSCQLLRLSIGKYH